MENEKKVTPGKIALAVAAVIVLAAALVAIVMTGRDNSGTVDETLPTDAIVEETVEATVPADGNPEDETAKGSYTASDEEVLAARETVVARIGDYTLTNGQLQVCYWMEVQNFLNSYGSYAAYFGLDYTKPLDIQVCGISDTGCTWQQFFLASALNSWKNYQSLAAEAEAADYQLDAALAEELAGIEAMMDQNAQMYGFENGEAFLQHNVGKGATMADYLHYMNLYYPGTLYFDQLCLENLPTEAEVEAYFAENEAAFLENGLAREDKYVSVRHILIMPEGADSSNIRTETFDDAAWASAETKAKEVMDLFLEGDKSEESFAALAVEYSQDGSASNGGLYTDIAKGQMVENFENWCFDEARQTGDYDIVKTEFGYHLMYYVSNRPVWVEAVENEMMSVRSNELLNGILSKYTMEAEFEKMLIASVDMGGGAENDAASGVVEVPVQAEPIQWVPVAVIAGVSAAALAAAAYVFNKKEHE
ncbi:MAG: peptidyl-prolyl cis-trans isomerase [Oscillospiraceae bacterium]|nr:peptidyl-prolyl cis-trans isomerase [Oscillospiraceae bacterium]